MPPKVARRPAARGAARAVLRRGGVRPGAKAAAKARGKARTVPALPARRRRPAAQKEVAVVDTPWIEVKDLKPQDLVIGEKYMMKIWYGQEEGLLHAEMKEETKDEEGQWIGVKVRGTPIHQVRSYVVSKSGDQSRLYLSQAEVDLGRRKNIPGLGYLLAFRRTTLTDNEHWMENCLDHQREGAENEALAEVAEKFGFPPRPAGPQEGAVVNDGPSDEDPEKSKGKKKKKLSGRQKVKQMLTKARWNPAGTPMDPTYKKPVKLKVQRRKSSSSSNSGSSSSEDSSVDGLGTEHRLKSIWRKLPGYLARCSAKEARKLLAEKSGENPSSLKIFYRYYRQVILPRGGSKGMQRELLTHSMLLDMMLDGEILSAMDVMVQRIKALELMQQGSEANLAQQLELLPIESLGLAADTEAKYAQKQFSSEAKLQKQLHSKGGSSGSGKGSWQNPSYQAKEGKGKGKRPWERNWDKGRGKDKGQKTPAEGTKVVPPNP